MEDGIENYRWCSLADYIKPASKRRSWLAVEEGNAWAPGAQTQFSEAGVDRQGTPHGSEKRCHPSRTDAQGSLKKQESRSENVA